jgi:glutathione S-transferase
MKAKTGKAERATERIRRERDAEWTMRVFEIFDRVLTPAEAKEWLRNDRVTRARNVSAARLRRFPYHY